jgi:hypothetical protein
MKFKVVQERPLVEPFEPEIEIFVEQDGKAVNLYARMNGTSSVIAWLTPNGVLHPAWMSDFDQRMVFKTDKDNNLKVQYDD